MKLREILLRLCREYFPLIYRAFIYLFMLFIYRCIRAVSVVVALRRAMSTFLCTSPAPWPPLRPLQGLSAYDNTNLIVSLRRLQSVCLSLFLPFFLLLLHFLFFVYYFFFFLLVLLPSA